MKPVLVTGGAGYIGSHTCKALARAGYLPISYDNLSRGHRWAVQWGPLEIGDIADAACVTAALRKYRPLAVLHFAGFGYVGESMSEPAMYYGNNVVTTWRLFETLRAAGLKDVVFSSSCATYGGMHPAAVTEETPQTPASTYGLSKLIVERMLADYSRAYAFRAISLRYFNVAGADPDGELGEAHDHELHFIPLVLRTAAGVEPAIRINGNDYPTPDGSCVRDFIHVSDVADAHVLALTALLERGITGAFNLGSGRAYSLKQIVDVARRVTGRTILCEFGPRRLGDPPFAIADAQRARRVLEWQPRFSDIETIVSSAWRWAKGRKSAHEQAPRFAYRS